jgi:hypothetical protein
VIGLAILGFVIAFLVWASVDAFVRYGLFTGLIVTGGAVVSFFIPFAVWIVIAGYLLFRISAAPRSKESRAWQKELKEMRRRRASESPALDGHGHAIGVAEKDAHLEELLAAGTLAEALRYAKEKAAQALEAGDHRAVRIYEKYLERIRRGSS